MTIDQSLSFAIIIGMMGLFAWGQLRYDLVALLALLAALAVGIVPADKAFDGFSDDIVIIVGSALVVSAAVARSGVIERVVRQFGSRLVTVNQQVFALVTAVTVLSAFVKNIGALAMLMPIAFQLARRTGTSPSSLLMPMSFGALLGGTMTLVGTSPNIIVSRMREEILGQPFGMFDFTPVGAGLALAGVAFLVFGWRLLPRDRKGAASMDAAFNLEGYTTEVEVPEDSPAAGITVKALEDLGEGEVEVITLIREAKRRFEPAGNVVLKAGDTLILQGEPAALERVVALEKLKLTRGDKAQQIDAPHDEIGVMEAVITPESELVGSSAGQIKLFSRHGVNLLAVSRRGRRIAHRLRSVKFRPGDVLVLQGDLTTMPETLGELHCLPLAERDLRIGRKESYLPIAVLAAAMALVAFHLVPVTVAFFGAAVLLLLARSLSLREAYDVIDWPILVMLGALIPVSEVVAHHRRHRSHRRMAVDGCGAFACGRRARPDPGSGDGRHAVPQQCRHRAGDGADRRELRRQAQPQPRPVPHGGRHRRRVRLPHAHRPPMQHAGDGPGGYRFGDYWRLGLPLSLIVLVAGVPLIMAFWPLGH